VPDPRHALGQRAEQTTATWLATRGWTILARRWRCADGELDIVALDPDGVLVAVEVKLRRGGRAGDPLESVGRLRRGRLRAALGRYRAQAPMVGGDGLRIDLVGLRPVADGLWRVTHHRGVDQW
jgi:putative endonuclease